MLADGIDIAFVLGYGLGILVPFMLFEVFVEALVLKGIWRIPYRQLCRFTFFANLFSLLAGIPIKILNAGIYSVLLPDDLPGYFATYPFAVAIGSLVYFIATLGVEGGYAFLWLRREGHGLGTGRIWKGIILANLATYIVLAPLHYFLTRPTMQMNEYTKDATWTSHPDAKVCFCDAVTGDLECMELGKTNREIIVPVPVRDYLVSPNLNLCLFRATNGNLCFHRRDTKQMTTIWRTDEKYFMRQVAFSPAGRYVAFCSHKSNFVEVVDLQTEHHMRAPLPYTFATTADLKIVWSTDETVFYGAGITYLIRTNGEVTILNTRDVGSSGESVCFGRVGDIEMYSRDWGTMFGGDSCGPFRTFSENGLDSHLVIWNTNHPHEQRIYIMVNPGLLHIAQFYFGDASFLEGCNEVLFEANRHIYLLDIKGKRIGTVANGELFVLMTPRFQKRLETNPDE